MARAWATNWAWLTPELLPPPEPPKQPPASSSTTASTALERAARSMRRRGIRSLRRRLASQVLLRQQRVLARPLDHRQQAAHAGDLLHLLLDEPLDELLARVIAVLACQRGQTADLLGHPLLLRKRQRHRLDHVREARADRKSTRLNSSHGYISYAVFCLKKKKNK